MKRLILRLVVGSVILAGSAAGAWHLRSGGSGGEDGSVAQAAEPSTGTSTGSGAAGDDSAEPGRPQPIADPQAAHPPTGAADPPSQPTVVSGDGYQEVAMPSERSGGIQQPNQPGAQPPAQPQVVGAGSSEPTYGSTTYAGNSYDAEPTEQPTVAANYDVAEQDGSQYSTYGNDASGGQTAPPPSRYDSGDAPQPAAPPSQPAYGGGYQLDAGMQAEATASTNGTDNSSQYGTYGQPEESQSGYEQPVYGQPVAAEQPQPKAVAAGQTAYAGEDADGAAPEDVSEQPQYSFSDEGSQPTGSQPETEQPQPLRFADEDVAPVQPSSPGGAAYNAVAPTEYAAPNTAPNPNAYAGSAEDAGPIQASLVSEAPGARTLEGTQTPAVSIQKVLPPEIQVGKPAILEIHVQNSGSATAHDVTVLDRVPQGTRLMDMTPKAGSLPDGSLAWSLGSLDPGEKKTLKLELMPEVEGEIGSVAQVVFHAQASARAVCTRPELVVEQSAPPKVLIGQNAQITILITNRGTGAAANVTLEEDVPPQFSHPAGNELENEIGTIRPGETRRLNLTLTAVQAGMVSNAITVRGEGSVSAESAIDIEVIAPQMKLAVQGPNRRYLQRQVTFDLAMSNPGTALAQDLKLLAYLPKGLTFVSSNKGGQYLAQQHAVLWSLQELAPAQNDAVQLTCTPVETGEQKIRVEGTGDLGLAQTHEHTMLVESVAELHFTVTDKADPIEVGSETVYEIVVANDGTKPDSNIQLAAALPPGLKPLEGEGPTRGVVEGQNIIFEPLPRLAPQDKVVFLVRAQGTQDGDQRIRVQIASEEAPTPVIKEEITRVYADR